MREKKKCVLEVQDIRSLSFPNNFFDGIACFHTLGNLIEEERKKSSRELSRVLKSGGFLFFQDFGMKDFRNGKGEKIEENTFKRKTGIVTHYFELDEVRELFHPLQLKSEEREQFFVQYDGKRLMREKLHAQFVKM